MPDSTPPSATYQDHLFNFDKSLDRFSSKTHGLENDAFVEAHFNGQNGSRIERAKTFAGIDKGEFVGEKQDLFTEVKQKLDRREHLEGIIEDLGTEHSKPFVKDMEALKKELGKDAQRSYEAIEKGTSLHGKAITAIEKQRGEVIKELTSSYNDAVKGAARDADAIKGLKEQYSHRKSYIDHHFDALKEHHTDTIKGLEELRSDIVEHSGIKPKVKAVPSTALAEAEAGAEKAATGGKLTFKSGAAALIGGAATLIGGKALLQDVGMLEAPRGADGEPEKGNFVMDAAVTAAGIAGLLYAHRNYSASKTLAV